MQGKIILAIFVVALFALSESKVVQFNNCKCGTPNVALTDSSTTNDKANRVVGGSAVRPRQHPWNSVIKVRYTNQSIPESTCQATLIHPQWILTSVRCFNNTRIDFANIQVYLGVSDQSLLHQAVNIRGSRILFNGQFPPTPATDIALIQLNAAAQITPDVQPICLSDVDLSVNEDGSVATGFVTGFATSPRTGEVLDQLVQFSTTVIPANSSSCSSIVTTANRERSFCGGNINNIRNQTLCPEDTGSPMIISNDGRWYLAGLANIVPIPSVRGQCNRIFSMLKISFYIDFIEQNINRS